ncbi:hypothetical protein DEU56DRAFT_755469 [Suillus clintonianus]|uniref:uncharacterized protein n=1 Tax=Suillus clintonianus TaxID=1904413 RepID=UPI001B87E425|nr:uncharacterized protein DEU56DRAFT_755469 [Suillus clintonianus]KAG2139709.1 hypothetical protein DEU56DRAFT_755469 [Suillus clintonianus]
MIITIRVYALFFTSSTTSADKKTGMIDGMGAAAHLTRTAPGQVRDCEMESSRFQAEGGFYGPNGAWVWLAQAVGKKEARVRPLPTGSDQSCMRAIIVVRSESKSW